MAPTITSIARKAGVSKGLVSRLLRGDSSLRISEERRKQIFAVRDSLAKSQKAESGTRRRLTYNFVIPCFGESIFIELQAHLNGDVFRQLRKILRENGFQISITTYAEDEVCEGITDLITSSKFCDGLLLVGETANEQVAKKILENKFPHVSSDFSAAYMGLNTVCEDAGAGIFQAVKHLKALGHERIGFLGRQKHHYSLFLAAMGRVGLPINEKFNCISPMYGTDTPRHVEGWRDAAQIAFDDWLEKKNNATAMVCHNDYGALGAINAMKNRGLVAGKDISIVGFDNIESDSDAPFLTTIEMDGKAIGERIAQLLINQVLHDQNQIVHEYMPVKFIPRKSTGRCDN